MDKKYFQNINEWQQWLKNNHNKSAGLWLIFYKKETGKPSLDYEEAVEEALCYGWIDSLIKKLDAERYLRKFTPRKEDSVWSALNKKRVTRLLKSGRMLPPGLAKVQAAQKNGKWEQADKISEPEMPPEFAQALQQHPAAKFAYENLAPSHQKRFCGWIGSGKRQSTREKRIAEAIQLLNAGKKLGMK